MALTQQQKDQLLQLKGQGLSKEQAMARVFRNSPVATSGRDSVGEDLLSAGKGLVSDFQGRGESIVEGFKAGSRGEQTPIETGMQLAGNVLGGAGDITFRGAQAAVTPFMSGQQEKAVVDTTQKALAPVGDAIGKTSERTQRNIFGGLGFLESIPGAKLLTQPISSLRRGGTRGLLGGVSQTTTPKTVSVSKTPEQIFDNVGKQFRQISQDPNLSPRAQQEAAEAALNWKEKYVGLTPDIKSRLGKMGEEKITEYIDAAYRRNVDDTSPTPYEVGAQNVNTALEQLDETLRSSGSQIGQARTKLATIKAPITSVNRVESVFTNELDKLNLTIKNGEIVQKPGTVSKTGSDADIRVLQSLYKDLLTFKQSPTLKNAIDLRMQFDGKVKFQQSARDVSNSVDPVSRSVRRALAEESAKVVGKSNAAELQRYSDFMEAYGDLKSFTDRAAGGEYLLRLVLSGRGGEARKLIDTVREYTGKDLMDDATAMKVATQMFSNENSQNLFKQEVTRAGYDAAAVLSGSPTGVLQVVGKRLLDYGIDPETVVKAAAAGTGGYLLVTYTDTEGVMPAGLVVLAAMPSGGRQQVITDAAQLARQTGKTLKLPDSVADEVLNSLNSDTPLSTVMRSGDTAIDADDVARLDALQTKSKSTALTDEELVEAGAIMEKYGEQFPSFNQGATPQTTSLIEEARKYDSAEEFVESQYQIRNVLIPDSGKMKYKMNELYSNEDLYAKYPILRSTNVRFVNRRNELLKGANGLAVGNDIVLADDLIKKTADVRAVQSLEKKLQPFLEKEAAGKLTDAEYKAATKIQDEISELVNKPGATVELTDEALRVLAHEIQHLKQDVGKKGVSRKVTDDILAQFAKERPDLDMSDYYGNPAELEARMAEGKIKTKAELKKIWEEANQ